jgi:hypothetical protein
MITDRETTPAPTATENRAPEVDGPTRRQSVTGIVGGGLLLSPAAAMAQTRDASASPGPGLDNSGVVDFTKTSVAGQETFDTFGCNVYKENAATPDWQRATVYFERKVFGESRVMPDGVSVDHWGFEDILKRKGVRPFPSPLMRVIEDDLVHVRLESSKGPHTIHHHGIEPTTMNDGVGHVSMEVSGTYVYQWQPRHAGTWFYHCHVNTVLHFQMGLYGPLIVDPKITADLARRIPAGKKLAYRPQTATEPLKTYDVERIWVFDAWDPRWHTFEHAAGLCGDDVGLNVFKPRYFFVSGVNHTKSNGQRTIDNATVAVRGVGAKDVLIRMINAHYGVTRVKFTMDVEVISSDGHSLNKPWCQPYPVRAGTWIEMPTARRYDVIVKNPPAGGFAEVEYTDWITRRIHNARDASMYIGQTRIPVSST